MYKLIKRDGKAKRGEFHTVHGVIQTPVFMNVGTAAAIKGAVSTMDLQQIGTQIYGMGQADPDGFRWIPGIFPGRTAQDQRRRRVLPFPCRRKKDLYGTGREHADPVESGIHDRHGI